jgi:guanine deaminase
VTDKNGYITQFSPASELHKTTGEIIRIPDGSFFLPTFADLHLHAPQFLYQGNGLDLPLMEWLDAYTYKAGQA